MRRSLICVMFVFLLLSSLTAVAQDYEEEEERDLLELCVFGGIAVPGNGLSDWGEDLLAAKGGWDLGLDFGYFLTPVA